MFVTEGPAGERLALRPDFTIPVCLEHLRSGAGPARYAYEGLVFRRHDFGAPERLETGYEDIGGADRIAADAEALALAVDAARQVTSAPLTVAARRYRALRRAADRARPARALAAAAAPLLRPAEDDGGQP